MKQRALRICYPFVGDTVGGSHLSALGLIRALPRERAKALVVVHQEGPFTEMLRQLGVPYAVTPVGDVVSRGGINPFADCQHAAHNFTACQLSQEPRTDVVHTNDMRMHLTWGPAARLAGARFVWHQRSAENSRRLGLYARLAHRVLTVSHFTKAKLAWLSRPTSRSRAQSF